MIRPFWDEGLFKGVRLEGEVIRGGRWEDEKDGG